MLVSIFQPGSLIPNALRALTDPRIHDTALQEADAAIAHWTAQVADFTAGQNRLEAILAREDVLDIDTILIKRNEMVSKKRQAEVALTRATQGRKALLVAETAHLHEWETLCHQWPSRWDVLSFEEKRELLVSLGPSFRVVYHHGSSRVSKIYNRKPADRTLPLLEIWGHLPFEAPLAFRLTAEMVEFYPTRTFTPGDPLPPPCATPQHRPEQTVAMLFVDTAECPLPAPNRSDG
jgi:hypothetical protein